MADPMTIKEILEAGKYIAPGGLPQLIDSGKRSGRRLRIWTARKSRVPIFLAIQSENTRDAGLIDSLAFYMQQYVEACHLESTVQVQTVSDDLDNTVALLKAAYRECQRLHSPGLAAMPSDFQRLHLRCKARMYLFGRLVRRTSHEQQFLELELQGILEQRIFKVVWQRPFLLRIGTRRTRVTPRFSSKPVDVIQIPVTDEDSGLRSTSSTLVLIVQTLIGISSQVQDDPIAAMDLLDRHLDQFLASSTTDPDTRKQLLKLLVTRCNLATDDALMRGDQDEVRRISAILARRCPDDYGALVTMTYAAYLLEPQHPLQALEYAKRAAEVAPGSGNGAWQYNLAFLLAQNGHFEESLREYDRIAASSYEGEDATLASVLLFFAHELPRHPTSVYVLFILGFLEWTKLSPHAHSILIQCGDATACRKRDAAYCRQAVRMFRWFVLLEHSPELAPWVARARVYVQRVDRHLKNVAAGRVGSGGD